jgi:hypothetical protein
MRVDVATQLDCSAAAAWEAVQTSALLLRVAWPLAKIVPVGDAVFPERWSEGLTVRCRSLLFGFIPTGVRVLDFETIDHANHVIQTRESDPLVRRWDHLMSIKSLGERRSSYRDVIDIDAGRLTFLVWAWATWFYRHRQLRWRTIAKSL